jgi:hypothetical protein
MQKLRDLQIAVKAAPDEQISLTDPDARSMATSGKGTGIVGYNVQAAVDARHHLIVAHDVTNVGHDREELARMAIQATDAMGHDQITAVADRGYFSGWVRSEISLQVLAYNMKRVIAILGTHRTLAAILA